MAVSSIAGAARVSKSALDRAVIFPSAHAAARRRMTPSRSHRYGDRWSTDAGGYLPQGFGYREAFACALRTAWHDAKTIAEEAAWEAAQPAIPADVAARVTAMRADAWYEPITTAGTAHMLEIYAEADEIEEAARLSIITAMDKSHHAAC